MKKKIMAVLATIAAVLGFGFATNTAMADDYGATVTYGGTTATVTFPAGTFQPNESVTVYYDDAIVADVQQIAEVSKTFTAKADGSLTLLYTFKASQAGQDHRGQGCWRCIRYQDRHHSGSGNRNR